MSLVETLQGKLKEGFENVRFLIQHDSTPEIVEQAREAVVRDDRCIQEWVDAGLFTRDRLQEIKDDKKLQQKYQTLMKNARDLRKNADEVKLEIMGLPIDQFAGWLEYFRKFHEQRFNINLLTGERITSKD